MTHSCFPYSLQISSACYHLDSVALDLMKVSSQTELSEVQIWMSLIEKASSLKTLHLYRGLDNSDFEVSKAYLESFKHLKTLENLTIDLTCSFSEPSNQTLSKMSFTHLSSLANLKSLDLTLSCWTDHPGFRNIKVLQSLSKLEQLCLDLSDCSNIDSTFLRNLALILPSLYELKRFKLFLPTSGIPHEGRIALFSSFKQLYQLKDLYLNLKKARLDHTIMRILCNNLAHLNLTSLKIIQEGQPQKPKSLLQRLPAFWEYEQRLTSLFSALYGFNSLESLSLDLSVFEISTKEFKHFSLALKELNC